MTAYLHAIACHCPGAAHPQQHLCDRLLSTISDKRQRRLVARAHQYAGIGTRHAVLPDLSGTPAYFDGSSFCNLSTGRRAELYSAAARDLFVSAACKALSAAQLEPSDITHLVTVSCTGFDAPGPGYWVQQGAGLAADLQHFHLGFMGCYAALPALELARALCAAEPDAVVLVVAGELCSLHLQPQTNLDAILSAALFGDGAAAAIVSNAAPGGPALRLLGARAAMVPETPDEITWRVTDTGFAMTLSRAVPRLLAGDAGEGVAEILARWQWPVDTCGWALHPGGPAILDSLESSLGVGSPWLGISRQVLSEVGNMSSPTLLFVLARLLSGRHVDAGQPLIALGFGPGIKVQGLLLEGC